MVKQPLVQWLTIWGSHLGDIGWPWDKVVLEEGKDDTSLLREDSDSGEITLEDTNNSVVNDYPVLVPPTEETTIEVQNTDTSDEWTRLSHRKKKAS